MSLLRSFSFVGGRFYKDAAPTALVKSGGGPPHSRTLARGTKFSINAKPLGVRQPSGALGDGIYFDGALFRRDIAAKAF